MRAPWVIAHRGASGHAPENTLAAFERAVELGAGFVESDLHLTRDAHFVAIHDLTLERTTNGTGPVREHTLAQLRDLEAGLWYDRKYMGERIPTIEEILAFARRHDIVIYLELKYEAAWGMHHALVGALRDPQDAARTVVISFDPSTLASLRRLDATIMTGLLVEEKNAEVVKAAIDVGARQLCLRSTLVTREIVDEAHRSDLHVATWTVNDPEEMRNLMAAGVDGVMTDFPDRLRTVINSATTV